MKRDAVGIGLIVAGMLIGGVGGMATSEAMGQKPKATLQLSGRVEAINYAQSRAPVLVVRTIRGDRALLYVNPKKVLVMRKGGQKLSWGQVRVGDAITADYYVDGRQWRVSVIRLEPLPATGTSKPATSAPKKK